MLFRRDALITVLCGVVFICVSCDDLEPEADFYLGEDRMYDPVKVFDLMKSKRQTGREYKEEIEEIFARFPLTSEKVRDLLRMLNKPKKSDTLKLKGWSASGMPFNVLYTPNNLQQKMISSMAERSPPPPPSPEPLRSEYPTERRDNRKQYLRQGPKASAQMRKHYLVIPQLFVSYGWGPLGK